MLTRTLHALYEGDDARAMRFHYVILALDVITLLFLIISTFFYQHPAVLVGNILIGAYILLDYIARLLIHENKRQFALRPLNIIDLVMAGSLLLAPLLGEGFAFLRALRLLRLLRSYKLLRTLRKDSDFFRRNEEIILRSTH